MKFPYATSVVYVVLGNFYGLGAQPEEVDLGKLVMAVQYGLRGEVAYLWAISLAKTSVGLGLLRIAYQRRYRIAIAAILIISLILNIGSLITVLKICTTVCDPEIENSCTTAGFPYPLVLMGLGLAAFTDAAFAIIPVLLVSRLRLPRRTKYALVAVFAFGSLGALASFARFPFIDSWVQLSPDRPDVMRKYSTYNFRAASHDFMNTDTSS